MAAEFLGAGLDEIELVQSTTIGLNTAVAGLVSSGFIKSGQQIVLTTDQEHAGGVAAYKHLVSSGVLRALETVALEAPPPSADDIVQRFATAFARHPAGTVAVLGVSHVLTTTGVALPLARLAQLAHAHGALLVVDGAQAATAVRLNLTASGADVYVTSGHKHLLGPTGSGVLYVRKAAQPHVTPTLLDGGFKGYSGSSGTAPLQTIAGLGYSLQLLNALGGMGAVAAHNNALAARVHAGLVALAQDVPGMAVLSAARDSGLASSLVSVRFPPRIRSADVVRAIHADGFVVKHLPEHEGGTPLVYNGIRISAHVYNAQADVDRLLASLRAALNASATATPTATAARPPDDHAPNAAAAAGNATAAVGNATAAAGNASSTTGRFYFVGEWRGYHLDDEEGEEEGEGGEEGGAEMAAGGAAPSGVGRPEVGLCTASLVSPSWILTASHCAIRYLRHESIHAQVKFVAGGGVTRGVTRCVHAHSTPPGKGAGEDAALCKLKTAVHAFPPVKLNSDLYRSRGPHGRPIYAVGTAKGYHVVGPKKLLYEAGGAHLFVNNKGGSGMHAGDSGGAWLHMLKGTCGRWANLSATWPYCDPPDDPASKWAVDLTSVLGPKCSDNSAAAKCCFVPLSYGGGPPFGTPCERACNAQGRVGSDAQYCQRSDASDFGNCFCGAALKDHPYVQSGVIHGSAGGSRGAAAQISFFRKWLDATVHPESATWLSVGPTQGAEDEEEEEQEVEEVEKLEAEVAEVEADAEAEAEAEEVHASSAPPLWTSINAVTLATSDMGASLRFYEALGLYATWRGANFTTLSSRNLSSSHAIMHVNLLHSPSYAPRASGQPWGRFIAYVTDVDEVYRLATDRGLAPEAAPADAPWGERFFQIRDPMGHEVAIARPL